LIRALHEWCCDNGFTPYVTVAVDNSVQVPQEYVKDGEIVLNIGFDATTALSMGNDYLEFKARFAGVVREIMVPVDQVIAIFARENGQGMAFPKVNRVEPTTSDREDELSDAKDTFAAKMDESDAPTEDLSTGDHSESSPPKPSVGKRPALTRIK
jgi:stringent starvation protein B